MKKGIFLALSVALFLGCSQTQPKPNAQSSSSEEPAAEYKGKERISLLEFEVKQDPSSLPQNLHNVNFGQDEILKRRFKPFTLRGVKFNPDDVFWAFRTYKQARKRDILGQILDKFQIAGLRRKKITQILTLFQTYQPMQSHRQTRL